MNSLLQAYAMVRVELCPERIVKVSIFTSNKSLLILARISAPCKDRYYNIKKEAFAFIC